MTGPQIKNRTTNNSSIPLVTKRIENILKRDLYIPVSNNFIHDF